MERAEAELVKHDFALTRTQQIIDRFPYIRFPRALIERIIFAEVIAIVWFKPSLDVCII